MDPMLLLVSMLYVCTALLWHYALSWTTQGVACSVFCVRV
jgi:hypothetical protein